MGGGGKFNSVGLDQTLVLSPSIDVIVFLSSSGFHPGQPGRGRNNGGKPPWNLWHSPALHQHGSFPEGEFAGFTIAEFHTERKGAWPGIAPPPFLPEFSKLMIVGSLLVANFQPFVHVVPEAASKYVSFRSFLGGGMFPDPPRGWQ